VMRGSHAGLAEAVGAKKLDTSEEVPSFAPGWPPTKDSNPAEGCAYSIRTRP
jgi:hypothetical protein